MLGRSGVIFGLMMTLVAASASAQTPTVRIRGDVDSLDGRTLHVTTRAGEKLTVALAPNTVVTVIAPSSFGAIKTGSYIGTAAIPQKDGTLRALEVQVFPESARGAGEGSRPFDLTPQSTMTNGTVGDVTGTEGHRLTVTYQGQKALVDVPDDAPVVTYEPGSIALLTPGAHILIFSAAKAADGSLSTSRVQVGKDGLVPPM
ncbi:MAG TPA: hypothetical protein VHS58_04320 [Acetobacteraceae bacterium]|jgi:hypothetical protein|nr:hypothetical protein [Acetobacteraceae bacterium]